MQAFRIADGRYPVFDGSGAEMRGGRWNSPGRKIVYAAERYSTAMLELLTRTRIGKVPKHHVWIRIDIPDDISTDQVPPEQIPGWDASGQGEAKAHGDAWYDSMRSAILFVPSVVARPERNLLINQLHPEFPRITASAPEPVIWDERLFRR
ncbi:MAG: RES domain-containing protein [Alphaproteobacteria bacterium]